MKPRLIALAVVMLALSSASASAQVHPNDTLFEYRVRNHILQGPWYSLPTGKEKGDWECTDQSTVSINCSFIRTDLSEFEQIYRKKKSFSGFEDVLRNATPIELGGRPLR
jgi:hypothetical protein